MRGKFKGIVLAVGLLAGPISISSGIAHAECPALPADLGAGTISVDLPVDATYEVWSRVKPGISSNDSYYLQVDGACAINVGDGGVPAGAWSWVNYQDGNTASKITMELTGGAHSLTLTGRETNVLVDSLLFVRDGCVPVDTGANCTEVAGDDQPPAISITSPADNATVSGTVNVQVSATDNVGVTKVEYYKDEALIGTVSAAPYGYSWNTAGLANVLHVLTAKAYDAAGLSATHTVNVNVNNTQPEPDTTLPVVTINQPQNGATLPAGVVTISASATDDRSVRSMAMLIGGKQVATSATGTITYSWNTRSVKGKTQTVEVRATDTSNNTGKSTITVKVAK